MSNETKPGLTGPLGPISWGLSKSFLASLSRTFVFGVFPDLLDPRDWMNAKLDPQPDWAPYLRQPQSGAPECEEFWFDYVADTGDSQRSTYSVAYLLHGDLYADAPRGALAARTPEPVTTEVVAKARNGYTRLPAGAFLLMGGDLAYAIADDKTLRERLVAPFDYAHQRRGAPPGKRFLFAVPGNHDWYDSLDGFNRLLRTPAPGSDDPAIALAGFHCLQQASYVALDLPFGWSLWGVDGRSDADVDRRQRAHFAQQRSGRLIVATPQPLVVFDEVRPSTAPLLTSLGLELSPPLGQARLYLSGDSHHYARYPLRPDRPGREEATSVVCGLGGASLHPPRNAPGSVRAERTFPAVPAARRAVLRRTLNPLHMIFRSGFAAFGALVGGLLGAGMAAFRGELSALLRHQGWLRYGGEALAAQGVPDLEAGWWPKTLVAAAVLVLGLPLFFLGIWKPIFARTESQAREKASKWKRGAVALAWVTGLSVAAVSFATLFDAHRSALSVALDLLVYVVLAIATVGLGFITVALGDATAAWSWMRKLGTFLLGVLAGAAIVALAGLALMKGLDALAGIDLVEQLLEHAGTAGAVGKAAYGAVIAVGAALGAVLGGLIFPVLFGLHISAQYLLGNQYTFPGSLALVDRYGGFIRFRLRRYADRSTEVTGFVIGIDTPVADEVLRGGGQDAAPAASLIDVFSVRGAGESG